MPVVVLLGAPGAGKGTQAPILARHLDVPILASGELLRDEVRAGTDLGREVEAIMQSGELVPDATIVALFLARLGAPEAANGAILDGFPRTTGQAEALDEALEASGTAVDRALLIDVPVEELVGRFAERVICLARGHVYNLHSRPPAAPGVCDVDGSELVRRADDAEATVRARMEQQLQPLRDVTDHYERRGVLTTVDGRGPIDQVTGDLLAALDRSPSTR